LLLHFIHHERIFLPVQHIVKVTAAIMSCNGRVLIAQRKAEHHQAGKWEFPGGKIESGETPEECLRRELKEEFDIDTRVGAFLGASLYPYDHQTIELLAFRVVWEDGILLVREHARVEWVRIRQLARFDFTPADVPFVEKLLKGEIAL
jgi:8-oxo-dGTP diphosphatase